jgi:pyruvate formate lyase activating enzyme
MKKEARLYKKINENLRCEVCPRYCVISKNNKGFCRTRINENGKLFSLIYAEVSSLNVDPIEKKPLFHFFPGTKSFSMGTVGCNLQCKYCQNWDISDRNAGEVSTQEILPEEAVKMAKEHDCKSISYTYNEPAIWFEYVYDTTKLAKEQGILNVLKTNGYISKEALKELLPFIDAASIDFKSIRKEFYQKLCNSNLSFQPSLETAKELIKNKKHVEIVNLVIPGWNDSDEDFKKLSKLVLSELGPQVPLHFTCFHPSHKLTDISSTPVKTLEKAREIAIKEGLAFVYLGNVPDHKYENTYCPKCSNLLIERHGFSVMKINLKDSACPKCNTKIPIIL